MLPVTLFFLFPYWLHMKTKESLTKCFQGSGSLFWVYTRITYGTQPFQAPLQTNKNWESLRMRPHWYFKKLPKLRTHAIGRTNQKVFGLRLGLRVAQAKIISAKIYLKIKTRVSHQNRKFLFVYRQTKQLFYFCFLIKEFSDWRNIPF